MLHRFAFIIFFLIPLISSGQFKIERYSVGEGLAQSQVYGMLEDSRGYIWMGTQGGGVSRFDGKKFTNFNTSNGLINNYVLSFYEDKEGNIWIGTTDGISIYNGIEFKSLRVQNLPNVMIGCFLEDKDGLLWLGTSNGIYTFNGKYFAHWSHDNGVFSTFIYDLFLAEDESIWASSNNGVLRIQDKSHRVYNTEDGLSNRHTRSIEGNKYGIFIGTFGGGLNRFDGSDFEPIGNTSLAIHDVFLNGKDIWLSTLDQGILNIDYKTRKEKSIKQLDGLSNNHTRLTIKDRWNNLWFATSGGGVNKYFGREFDYFTTSDGLKENYIYDVFRASNGDLWTSYSKGLTVMKEDTIIYYNSSNQYYGNKARVITEDHLGNIWIGTDGNSVFCFNGTDFHQFDRQDGILHYWITDIVQDKNLNIWVATSGGLCKLKPIDPLAFNYEITSWKKELGVGNNANINCVEEDQLGRIWYGSRNRGIGYLLDNQITTYNSSNGLPGDQIKSFELDSKGKLWIGTEGKGVIIANTDESIVSFNHITTSDGLASNNTYLIAFDWQENAWIGSERGVDKLTLSDSLTVLDIKHYGKSEGFEGVETNRNAACNDQQGNLWFGTINGLIKYNPKNASINTRAPLLSLSNVTLFYADLVTTKHRDNIGDWFNLDTTLVLSYNENHIGFEFKGINHKNPENVYYQFKLEGFDSQWSPASDKSDATYSNLPAGNYTFKVIAGNEDNVWTENPVTFSFSITPPFWKTWFFIIGSIGLGSILLVALVYGRIRTIKKNEREKRQRLKLEKEVLEVEQKALRLQMNPHFIFNSMNSVQALILRNDPNGARYYLTKFSKLMRRTLENSRAQFVNINEEVETLRSYLDLENFGRETPFEYHVHVDEHLDPENILIPPMLLQPFAENTIIHGFKNLDRIGVIKVAFEEKDGVLAVSIADNGIGRKASSESTSQVGQKHKSTALQVTQERLAILNSSAIKNGFEIIDLTENGLASGTKIVLRMRLLEEF